jgi:endonuclease/exonuclease/phosphatase family metal-dependent hydrolase
LAWFAFSAPSVIARWTEGDYRFIVMAVSLLALTWVGVSISRARWIENISSTWLFIWNLLFSLSLILTILAHRVPFPQTPDSPAIVIGTPSWIQHLPLVVLLLYPIIFLDLRIFSNQIRQANPNPRDLIPGMLLGGFLMILLIFMHIFTNVWSRVEPVSPWFRNKFWLPYLLMAGLLTLLIWRKGLSALENQTEPNNAYSPEWLGFLVILFLGTAGSALITTRIKTFESRNDTIVVMTYNIQQAIDDFGERSYKEQLALIRQIEPDILALQESSSNRISLNNNDFVRYYAGQLGYYAYYGPTIIAGTYGTAILSKYPLQNTRTVYTYSDQDEIGTAEAEIKVDGEILTVYSVHPDGSDTAMLVWAKSLLERSQDKSNVIVLGDYNLRDYEEAYQLIDRVYTNAWVSVYPSKISSDGTDMSGKNRIDHIFLSHSLVVGKTAYILPPESASDHPVHWAEIIWKK